MAADKMKPVAWTGYCNDQDCDAVPSLVHHRPVYKIECECGKSMRWHPLYTADQIRAEIEAVRAEYPIARDGELAAIVHHALDALKVRLGLES